MSEVRLEAALWDMDGVIADTGEYHYRAWRDVFKKRGKIFSKPDFMDHFGQRHDTIIRFVMGDNISPSKLDAISGEKQAAYRRLVAGHVRAFPGVIMLLESLKEHGIKSAIASSAPTENIDIILGELDIRELFQAVAWGTEVAEGKPSPGIFLLAAEKLEVSPERCVVIEDAIAGVRAARLAGMKCIAVTNSHPRNSLAEADLIVDSLETVTVPDLEQLFSGSD
jgi:beta-phosphoglucomutase family hydrolase